MANPNPVKVRSYVDHWPRSGDTVHKMNPNAYVDHFPESGDVKPTPTRTPNSYIGHWPKTGDLRTQ
jgi:hypothetical protein